MEEKESGSFIGVHYPCIANEVGKKRKCDSGNALALYEHEDDNGEVWYDAYCYSCKQNFWREEVHSSSLSSELGVEPSSRKVTKRKKFSLQKKQPKMTKSEVLAFIKETGYKSNNYRGIKDEYSKFFGHLTKLDNNGNVLARYYPETEGGIVTGYKCRNHPKDFRYGKLGKTGSTSELSGQIKFQSGGKYLLILAGEEDKVAAFQMLRDYQISRGQEDYAPIATVSPTTGEPSAAKQIASQYDFCDSFDIIIIGMDNDEVGREAAKAIADVLPKDKVKIATWTHKDPNKMLQLNMSKQFLRDFYNAKDLIKGGVKDSVDALSEVEEFLTAPKISLPSYMHRLQENMRGGIKSTGAIVNIIGDTSIGKSYLTDNLNYHWFYNSPITPTIVSLERTAGELAVDMLSLHLKKNLTWFKEGMDAVDYLNRDDVKEQKLDLFISEEGKKRFYIIDERDGDVNTLKEQVDKVSKKYDSKLIVFDPLTDYLRSLGTEEQENFMMWQKLRKKEGFVFINVLHTRKPPTDKEGNVRKVTEYDALGSGTFVQSADINIVINRDKMAESSIDRNTTVVDMPKCRGGTTGHAADWYYDTESRQQCDLIDWLAKNK